MWSERPCQRKKGLLKRDVPAGPPVAPVVKIAAMRGEKLLFAVVIAALPMHAQADCPTAGTRAVAVKSISDGDTFFTTDGAEVDLAGLLAPGSGGERIGKTQARAATEALAQALAGSVSLAFAGAEKDRYGRLPAQVFVGAEWIQGKLLRAGLARADPETAPACAKKLLAAETESREAKRGLWAAGMFAVLPSDKVRGGYDTFQIVEGTVQAVAQQKGRVYLDFGADWKTDFTAMIAPDSVKEFRREKINLKKLANQPVRVRGWVESYYGPEIELFTPGALEILQQTSAQAKRPGD